QRNSDQILNDYRWLGPHLGLHDIPPNSPHLGGLRSHGHLILRRRQSQLRRQPPGMVVLCVCCPPPPIRPCPSSPLTVRPAARTRPATDTRIRQEPTTTLRAWLRPTRHEPEDPKQPRQRRRSTLGPFSRADPG